jgi:hypothetical protein
MAKPNFKQMSKKDLIAYVRANRNDDEAVRELFVNRRNPNATRYPAPLDPETMRITENAIAAKIKEQTN